MGKRYVIIDNGSDYHRAMWQDVLGEPRATYVEGFFAFPGRVVRWIGNRLFRNDRYRRSRERWRRWLYRYYALETVPLSRADENFVLLMEEGIAKYDITYLLEKKRTHGVRFVLVLVNPYFHLKPCVLEKIPYCDRVFTIEPRDAQVHGFERIWEVYSKADVQGAVPGESDLVFIGNGKGREALVQAVYERLGDVVRCDFMVASVAEADMRHADAIGYNRRVPYQDVLRRTLSSGCVLDLVQAGQTGLSIRLIEALCYDRRLLTNNASVKALPYYDPAFIQVFETVDQIDPDFVLNPAPVSYGYQGECSPLRLLERL